MQAIVFALISYIGWGIGDVFGTMATRRVGAMSTTFYFVLIQAVIFAVLIPFYIGQLQNSNLGIVALNVLLGLLGTAGLITFYAALKISNAPIVGTISASFAAVTVILSIIFLGDRLTITQAAAVVIIFLGIIVSTLDFQNLDIKSLISNKGVALSLVSMVTWGIYWAFIKIPVNEYGWFWAGYISSFSSVPLMWLFLKFKKIPIERNLIKKKAILPLIANATLLGIGALSFNIGIEKGLTAIVAPIAGSYPTLFALLAYLAFRDPIKAREIVGIIITLVGIVILSLNSIH